MTSGSPPSTAISAKAREKSRSPTPMARSRPERATTVGGPRRTGAPSRAAWGGATASARRAVEDVVVDERRHVDELDGGGRADRALASAIAGRHQDQDGAQPLSSSGERRLGLLSQGRAVAPGELGQPVLDPRHLRGKPGAG